MTRVRGSEGMWEEVEKTSEASDSVLKTQCVFGKDQMIWQVIWSIQCGVTVKDWLKDCQSAAGNFFHYCINLCDNLEESYEVRLWMLNLIANNVAKDEGWLDSVHTAKNWGQMLLSGDCKCQSFQNQYVLVHIVAYIVRIHI